MTQEQRLPATRRFARLHEVFQEAASVALGVVDHRYSAGWRQDPQEFTAQRLRVLADEANAWANELDPLAPDVLEADDVD